MIVSRTWIDIRKGNGNDTTSADLSFLAAFFGIVNINNPNCGAITKLEERRKSCDTQKEVDRRLEEDDLGAGTLRQSLRL